MAFGEKMRLPATSLVWGRAWRGEMTNFFDGASHTYNLAGQWFNLPSGVLVVWQFKTARSALCFGPRNYSNKGLGLETRGKIHLQAAPIEPPQTSGDEKRMGAMPARGLVPARK